MSWKMKCPVCGDKLEFEETGRHYHVKCNCEYFGYCLTHDELICLKHRECAECYYRENIDEDYDAGDCWGGNLCEGQNDGDCRYENIKCDKAEICSSFFFHPVWHKVIHCPYCGSFDVDETDENNIWILHCNDCDKTFNLKKTNDQKNREQNNKPRKSKLERKITLEERRVKLLKEYKELYDNGVIEENEYHQKRNELLSSLDLK